LEGTCGRTSRAVFGWGANGTQPPTARQGTAQRRNPTQQGLTLFLYLRPAVTKIELAYLPIAKSSPRALQRCTGEHQPGRARPRVARPMHDMGSRALVRPRAARGAVAAGNNSGDSCIHAEGEKGQLGHSGRLKVEIDSGPPAVLSTSMCRTAPVATGYHLQVVGSCIVGHPRPLKRKFFPKPFFCKTQKTFARKKYRICFFNSSRFRGTPGGLVQSKGPHRQLLTQVALASGEELDRPVRLG
jgi:hypothetical protein